MAHTWKAIIPSEARAESKKLAREFRTVEHLSRAAIIRGMDLEELQKMKERVSQAEELVRVINALTNAHDLVADETVSSVAVDFAARTIDQQILYRTRDQRDEAFRPACVSRILEGAADELRAAVLGILQERIKSLRVQLNKV